jgi:hypothetical protein
LSVWDGLLGVDLPGLLGASVGVTVSVFGLDAAKAVVATVATKSALARRPTTSFFIFIGFYLLPSRISCGVY